MLPPTSKRFLKYHIEPKISSAKTWQGFYNLKELPLIVQEKV